MLRWEDAGSTGVVLGDAPDAQDDAVPAFVRDCAVPVVVCAGAIAAVRGTATLIRVGGDILLLTAAHLFDDGVRFGDLVLPLPNGRGWVSLNQARLRRDADADIAIVRPSRAAQAALAAAYRAVPLAAVATEASEADDHRLHYVAGYPAALSRRHEDWLVARRLVVMSGELPQAERPAAGTGRDLFLEYRRVAARTDGIDIHTPPLEGVSGAAVWGVRRVKGRRHLLIVGVQSSFRHGGYLRAHRVPARAIFSRP